MMTAHDFFEVHPSRRFGAAPPVSASVNVTVRPDNLFLPALGAAAQVLAQATAQPEGHA